jgi:hypothetical protein
MCLKETNNNIINFLEKKQRIKKSYLNLNKIFLNQFYDFDDDYFDELFFIFFEFFLLTLN